MRLGDSDGWTVDQPTHDSVAHGSENSVSVRLFGALKVNSATGVDLTPTGRKAKALLAHVILCAPHATSRERLAGLLWHDRGDEQARGSLRQTLHELRHLTSGADRIIQVDRQSVRLIVHRVETDLHEMLESARLGDSPSFCQIIGERPGLLLADLVSIDPEFDFWLDIERSRRAEQRMELGQALANESLRCGAFESARQLARRLCAAEPFDEEATRLLIDASCGLGDLGGARRDWQRYRLILQSGLNTRPSSAMNAHVSALLDCVSAVDGQDPDAPPLRLVPTKPSFPEPALATPIIAVPGRKVPRVGVLAIFIAATTVTAAVLWSDFAQRGLARPTLFVQPLRASPGDPAAQIVRQNFSAQLSRTIIEEHSDLDVADLADAPDPVRGGLLMTGEVRTWQGETTATTRLLDAEHEMIWSQTFTNRTTSRTALVDEMTARIADVLACALGARHPMPVDLNLSVKRLYLAACEQKHGDWERGRDLLQQVVQRAPSFSHAWAMLAAATGVMARSPGDHLRAVWLARHALALNPGDAEAYYGIFDGSSWVARWSQNRSIVEQGLRREPDNSTLLIAKSGMMMSVGYLNEATRVALSAVQADPGAQVGWEELGALYGVTGNLDMASKTLEEAARRFPRYDSVALTKFAVAARTGDPAAASAMLGDATSRGLGADEADTWRVFIRARATRAPVDITAAARVARKRGAVAPAYEWLDDMVDLVQLGHVDDAYLLAERVSTKFGEPDVIYFADYMAPFRSDPRFPEFARRLGLVRVWRERGQLPDYCGAALPARCRLPAL